jgi:23S rRNA-/tRNA-specific pseudouridylate synthase
MRLQLSARKESPTDLHYVHGLDGPVSGIMLFAKNELTKNTLRLSWSKAVRRYALLVQGEMPEKSGTIAQPLDARADSDRRKREPEVVPTTKFKVLKSFKTCTLVEAEPFFEQKYQLRKHFAGMLCPILGDRRHGAKTNPLGRLAVHLFHVSIQHPMTKEPLKITVPIPREFTTGGKSTGKT